MKASRLDQEAVRRSGPLDAFDDLPPQKDKQLEGISLMYLHSKAASPA